MRVESIGDEQRFVDALERGDRLIEHLMETAAAILEELTPRDSGLLVTALRRMEGPVPTPGGGFWGGVGDLELLGDIGEAAPRGTISAFIEWYRQQRAGEVERRKIQEGEQGQA